MAEMYRKSKVLKYRKLLEGNLGNLEKSIETLKVEGIDDGFRSLLSKYNTIFDLLDDFCMEFDLERPKYPSWWAFTGDEPQVEDNRLKILRNMRGE